MHKNKQTRSQSHLRTNNITNERFDLICTQPLFKVLMNHFTIILSAAAAVAAHNVIHY